MPFLVAFTKLTVLETLCSSLLSGAAHTQPVGPGMSLTRALARKVLADMTGRDLGFGGGSQPFMGAVPLLLQKIIIKLTAVKISNVLFNILVSFNYSQLSFNTFSI